MGLRLPARSFATSCARANSNSSVPTPSPSDVPNPRRRDPRLAPRLKDLKPEDVHTPIVYRTRIPRSAAFRTRFKDAPEHQHINFPHPMFATPPEGKRPSAVGEASDPTYTIGAVMGMQPGEVRKLSNFNIITKRVVNMTKKGKQ